MLASRGMVPITSNRYGRTVRNLDRLPGPERAQQLVTLAGLVAQTAGGRGQAVRIAGEVGSGKSQLAAEAQARPSTGRVASRWCPSPRRSRRARPRRPAISLPQTRYGCATPFEGVSGVTTRTMRYGGG